MENISSSIPITARACRIGFNLFKATTLGIQLINDLSRQIGGSVQYENKIAQYTINFTNRNLRKNED